MQPWAMEHKQQHKFIFNNSALVGLKQKDVADFFI